MAGRVSTHDLHRLAAMHGVQATYDDSRGERTTSAPESIVSVLQALGVPLENPADAANLLQQGMQERSAQRVEPVVVNWVDAPGVLQIRIPEALADTTVRCVLDLEDGLRREWDFDLAQAQPVPSDGLDAGNIVVKALPLPEGLPWGYHELRLTFRDVEATCRVISSPRHAFTGQRGRNDRLWGAFLPLYAVHSSDGMGAGTYTDLEFLVSWTRDLGGEMFGTLPLLATFLNEPFEPSPYSPVSRRFWNEFFLDISTIPELDASSTARATFLSNDIEQTIMDLRRNELVDYQGIARVKRTILSQLSQALLDEPSERRAGFHEWVNANPLALEYARYMATVDRSGTTWQEWPARQRGGNLQEGDFDPSDAHYHLYVQWNADQQLAAISGRETDGSGLYLDLPLGVHIGGFDVWHDRDVFAVDSNVGAPPDMLNANGQDWGFPPLHPERVREDRYDYFIACIQHHLQFASALRVDHVMGMHRLFWIPQDTSPRDGVYVRYNADELYAILTLESHRNQTMIVGEDLGTVPGEVREAMTRHHIQRMWVFPFQIGDDRETALREVDSGSLACLNTHDLPPFAAGWAELDAEVRERILWYLHDRGWLLQPTDDPQMVLGALIRFLGDSPARLALVNLEDLWLETERQNVPGTRDENPNWRRKARYDLDAFSRMPRVTDALRELDLLRKRGS